MSTKMLLTKGKETLVDEKDFHRFSRWRYAYGNTGYAVRHLYAGRVNGKKKTKTVYLHREILGVKDHAIHVDHINGDKLDNRRVNLRLAEQWQNHANSRPQKNNPLGIKGVAWHKKSQKWRARIKKHGKEIHLGSFEKLDDARRAYKEAAKELFGEYRWRGDE